MATLNPSNVVNGNTIQASDIEQLYNAFGTGSAGFATITGVSMTGSLNGIASTASFVLNAVSSSFASTASFVKTAQSASYVLNAVSSSFASTASFVTLAQTASYVLNAVSSSFASTASQANQLNGIIYSASLATPNTNFIPTSTPEHEPTPLLQRMTKFSTLVSVWVSPKFRFR